MSARRTFAKLLPCTMACIKPSKRARIHIQESKRACSYRSSRLPQPWQPCACARLRATTSPSPPTSADFSSVPPLSSPRHAAFGVHSRTQPMSAKLLQGYLYVRMCKCGVCVRRLRSSYHALAFIKPSKRARIHIQESKRACSYRSSRLPQPWQPCACARLRATTSPSPPTSADFSSVPPLSSPRHAAFGVHSRTQPMSAKLLQGYLYVRMCT